MRKIAPVLLVLFAFICVTYALRAQSGRSRSGQTTTGPVMNKTDRDTPVNEASLAGNQVSETH
jgi:hypothetical protein